MLTYGDGVGNVNIKELAEFHKNHKKLATITAVQPGGRFGALELKDDNRVTGFQEKPRGDNAWINGGFFVMEPKIFDYIEDDTTRLEWEPLENLSKEGELMAYRHSGFWQPMDVIRDKNLLENLWNTGNAPWKLWE